MAQRVSSSRQHDFLLLTLAGALTVVAGLAGIVEGLVRVVPNRDVPVTVDLADVPHELLLDGSVAAEATEAVVRVSALGPVPYMLVVAAALLPAITLLVVAVCFALLGRSFYRGDFFTRGNLVALNAAAAALGAGAVVIPTLEGTAASSALVNAGAESGQAMVLGLDMTMLLAGLLLAAVGYAFQRGARLKRDTEGLV
ncbi:DUF2975 domain-containing protein [Promicromonospora kroppenstedtii]|uniref:DUF2975 domain-containing protein n=1 Tax=Promicromonospora kroppenstedtii TaxID=440482 RepID=UPI0004B7F055|nr:DUF2975 domain-containing protein [Promicromonospora kroppenstedtii]